jgi:hypothetical protein
MSNIRGQLLNSFESFVVPMFESIMLLGEGKSYSHPLNSLVYAEMKARKRKLGHSSTDFMSVAIKEMALCSKTAGKATR